MMPSILIERWRQVFHQVESYALGEKWCVRITIDGATYGKTLAAIGKTPDEAEYRMASFLRIHELFV